MSTEQPGAPRPAAAGRIKPQLIRVGEAEVGVLGAGQSGSRPVLLVHGFAGDMLTWQFQVVALARRYRVFAVDLPGHGLSAAPRGIGNWRRLVPWLAEVIDALGVREPHLVGHSLGARICLGLVEAGHVPARSLTLIACIGIAPLCDSAFLERLAAIESSEDALACAGRLFGAASADRERFARALKDKFGDPGSRAKLGRFLQQNLADGRLTPAAPLEWTRVVCPLQLIWGTDDTVVPLPAPEWLPNRARLHLVERTGHMPHIVAADRVNRWLLEFAEASDAAQPQSMSVAAQE